MAMNEVTGFIFIFLGFIIVLLFHLIGRVSTLTRSINNLKKSIRETSGTLNAQEATSFDTSHQAVPNAVIAAISAAVNQYRIENK